MPEPWIRDHFGPETTAREGFREELAGELSAGWRTTGGDAPTVEGSDRDQLWAATVAEPASPHRPAPTRAPMERRPPAGRPVAGSRRPLLFGLLMVGVAAVVVGVIVLRRPSDSGTAPGGTGTTVTGGVTLPGGGSTVPGQTIGAGDTTATGDTTVASDVGTVVGTQYMSPDCHETRPTTAIPAAIDPALLSGSIDEEATPTFSIQLPEPLNDASFIGSTDVRMVPGGVLVKASLTLPDGTTSDTLLSVINNDGVVRWTRCFTNAYNLGPFGENGDGSLTIWVARTTTALARDVDLATGDTSDLFDYTPPSAGNGATEGLSWSISGHAVLIWLPTAAELGPYEVTLP